MQSSIEIWLVVMASSLALCLGTISCGNSKGTNETTTADASTKVPTQTAQTQPDLEKQRQEAEQQARPGVEKERKQAEEEATKNLDQDAIAAINDTQAAIDAIASNKSDAALKAIEQATRKINILLARNPRAAFIPVSVQVVVIDSGPHDLKAIKALTDEVSVAVAAKDYPAARVVLDGLASEIRVRTYSLPLGTYPDALKEAARLLDQKKNDEASSVLLAALNTLVAVDRVTPLPLVLAREALDAAREKSQSDKTMAETLVQTAKNEIERAKALGYAAKDPDYANLNTDIASLEKQLKSNEDTGSVFAKLEDKLSGFLKRQSQQERR
ncbi:MAG: YfdX family protein [Terriglobales bacterium]